MKTEIQRCLDGEIFNTSDAEIQKTIQRAQGLTKDYHNLVSTEIIKK